MPLEVRLLGEATLADFTFVRFLTSLKGITDREDTLIAMLTDSVSLQVSPVGVLALAKITVKGLGHGDRQWGWRRLVHVKVVSMLLQVLLMEELECTLGALVLFHRLWISRSAKCVKHHVAPETVVTVKLFRTLTAHKEKRGTVAWAAIHGHVVCLNVLSQ